MTDRKYTFKVEIDSAQAKQQAEELRRQLQAILDDIMPQQRGGGQGGPVGEMLEAAQKPAQELKRTLAEVAQVDLTAGTDALLAELDRVQREIARTRNEYERMSMTAAARNAGGTQRSRANFNTYVEEVRKAAGDDAAESARRTGRAVNIGQLGAEFKNDEAALYGEAERDALRAQQENTQKRRFNAAEKLQLAELEAQLLASELQAIQMQHEVTRRQAEEAAQRSERMLDAIIQNGSEIGPAEMRAMDEAERLWLETKELAQQQAEMFDALANANQRLSTEIAQQESAVKRAAAKASGEIVQAGGAVTTQQTAITVTKASAENAQALAVALREAAEASDRLQNSRMNTNVRGFELELERERQKIAQQTQTQTAALVESQRQQTAVVAGEQRRQTEVTRAEMQERVALARAEADVSGQEARAQTAARIEQEKRITAETRAQIRAREREERLAAVNNAAPYRRPFSVGNAWNRFDMAAGMVAGGLGAIGAVQVGQAVYDAGRQGAILERQAATFREFAGRMEQDANRIVEAVQRASGQTMTEFDAMGIASQVLASKFAQGSTDIAADLETAVAASRRFSQIFLDENGQAMGVQEIFARLVKFAREGNKELVDQFGLSNQLIAEAMGTTVDGLASAQGATLRWQGLIKVLNSELGRLGTAATTTAEKYEQSEARIQDARQRMQMALAGPMAGVAEWGAGVAEGLVAASGGAPIDLLAQQLRDNPRAPMADARQFKTAADAVEAYNQALAISAETTATYSNQLQQLLSTLANRGWLDESQVGELERLERTLEAVALGVDAYSAAMSVTTMEGMQNSEIIFRLARSMGALENMYAAGDMTLEQYSEQIVVLANKMRDAADAAGYLNGELSHTSTLIGPVTRFGTQRRVISDTPERIPFFTEEQQPWALPDGMSERQAAARYQQWLDSRDRNAARNEIINETYDTPIQNVRLGISEQLTEAQAQVEALKAAYDGLGDSTTAAMTQGLDAMDEQVSRLQLLDQTAQLVDQALRNGQVGADGFKEALTTVAAQVIATNTVTDAQVGILQRLIGALIGAQSAALGFAGAQTQYEAAMAAKNAKYSAYAGYNYGLLAPRFDTENRTGQREAMYNRAMEDRRASEEAQRAWESAAKKTASEFEAAAKKAASAFEAALRSVPGLFGTSSVTGEQMAGAAAGVPQEFADNYLRRLADEVAGNKDWEGIDIRDAAARAGIDPNLPKEMILEQVRGAWADSSLFAGGRNLDLITEYGGLDAIKANLARQDASASGQQALMDFLKGQGLGPGVVGAPGAPTTETGPGGLPTPEAAPDYAQTAVAAIEQAFDTDSITAQLQVVGENTIAAIHAGYTANAGRLNWAGPLVDAVAAQVLTSLNTALTAP
jgi:hypothetical protein